MGERSEFDQGFVAGFRACVALLQQRTDEEILQLSPGRQDEDTKETEEDTKETEEDDEKILEAFLYALCGGITVEEEVRPGRWKPAVMAITSTENKAISMKTLQSMWSRKRRITGLYSVTKHESANVVTLCGQSITVTVRLPNSLQCDALTNVSTEGTC